MEKEIDVGIPKLAVSNEPLSYNICFGGDFNKPLLTFKRNDEGLMEVEGDMTPEAVAKLTEFVDQYNFNKHRIAEAVVELEQTLVQCNRLNYCSKVLNKLKSALRLR